ncbi:hypothetical protein DPSP01_009353 [Paraphaeosphaeria sporulosa]
MTGRARKVLDKASVGGGSPWTSYVKCSVSHQQAKLASMPSTTASGVRVPYKHAWQIPARRSRQGNWGAACRNDAACAQEPRTHAMLPGRALIRCRPDWHGQRGQKPKAPRQPPAQERYAGEKQASYIGEARRRMITGRSGAACHAMTCAKADAGAPNSPTPTGPWIYTNSVQMAACMPRPHCGRAPCARQAPRRSGDCPAEVHMCNANEGCGDCRKHAARESRGDYGKNMPGYTRRLPEVEFRASRTRQDVRQAPSSRAPRAAATRLHSRFSSALAQL